jgi:CheY-like chemotaxis protein
MEEEKLDILLIEDNSNDAELTIRALKKNKVASSIVHLRDGASALDFLFGKGAFENRDTGIKPKIILLDLKMPKVDGIEVLRKIKTDELTKKIPVVVFTSSKETSDLEKAYSYGANSYIVKPVDFDAFSSTIAETGRYWILLNQLLS